MKDLKLMSPAKLIKRLFLEPNSFTLRELMLNLIIKCKKLKHRGEVFIKELSCLRMLLRQGLPIRGHTEQEGNLMQLLCLRSDDDPQIKQWIKDSKYLSVDIVNECVMLMGQKLLRELLSNIHKVGIFSVLADETRDITSQEQLSICIRWVDEEFTIHEDLIGLVHVEKNGC